MYIARIYEKLTAGKNVYGRKTLLIPRPEFIVLYSLSCCTVYRAVQFIVLYNGRDPYPEKKVLRLSDAFEDAVKLGIPKESLPPLELTVTVYNINQGYNREMVRRCETLKGYCAFIAKVREIEAESRDLGAAVEGAVKWRIRNEVLKGFFETHGSEVVNMLMAEWSWEDALVVERKEGWEEGWEEGREYGWEKGQEKGREEGWEKGLKETARNALAEGLPNVVLTGTGINDP